MESVETKDYFTHVPRPAIALHGAKPQGRPSVSFYSPAAEERPHPKSRMSTHRIDTSSTNFAEVLHDDGGPDGLRNLDIDYFNTVLNVFRDQKQHHSPVIFDFMLLHEINIHRLEHLLLAEWDWLSTALVQESEGEDLKNARAEQAPTRLNEIQSLLHKYSVALRDFEDMRKRATLDDASNPLKHSSSWHEKLLHLDGRVNSSHQPAPSRPAGLLRRVSHVLQDATLSKNDPEELQTQEAHRAKEAASRAMAPNCRQLAGVEDWKRDFVLRELSEQQKAKALRDEKIANRLGRFLLAVIAGIALIGPMLLMSLVGTLKCSLATTSVATLISAMLLANFTKISERDIITVTAAYAAVLVVFVGTQH